MIEFWVGRAHAKVGALAASLALGANLAQAQVPPDETFDEERTWIEVVNALPELPRDEDLIRIPINIQREHKYFVDEKSVRVDVDGVVRYTLVVDAEGGARNISYEGIRCETREKKVYSAGRLNGTWGKIPGQKWERISNRGIYGHHQTLYKDFFCPGKQIVADRDEALTALKKGVHPRALPRR